jgi:hypothetical protein
MFMNVMFFVPVRQPADSLGDVELFCTGVFRSVAAWQPAAVCGIVLIGRYVSAI